MPIRIFVGCADRNADLEAQAALEWSLRKHTTRDLAIVWMQDRTGTPWSGWNRERWTTPFSGFRWSIPEICGFRGEAIYTDSDVLFLADIGELWDQVIAPGKTVIAIGQAHGQRYCVSKWNCEAARDHIPPLATLRKDPQSHRALMQYFAQHQNLVQQFSGGNWNCLDLEPFNLGVQGTKAVHFTGIPTQPHLKHALPRLAKEGRQHWYGGLAREHPRPELQALFDHYFEEAVAAGYSPENYRV